ncbi:MAG: PEP-CTERM sorting domain-containing protein [Verrucomicrobia bacterium]|nr:PEP-CTERM sorting domain-containing protein [Verrucomicrobiota bacterium]
MFLPGENFGSFRIADFGNNSGTVNLSGTGVVNAANYTAVGGWGNGTLNITGGTWNQLSEEILVGDAADPNWTGRGEVNQSGGTVNATEIVLQKGTYNLNGGLVLASGVLDTAANATGVFNFNGGTLRARENNANFIAADTVETKGMVGAGSLTKTGSGVLKLDGSNTFAGDTAVNQGTLTVNGSLAGGVSVASGSLLKGSGTIGGASTVNGTLAAGNSPGLMTFSSDLSLGTGSNLVWELFGNTSSDTAQYDRISVGGNLLAASGAGITLDFGTAAAGSTVDWANTFWDSAQSWTFLTVAGSTTGFSDLSLLNSTFLDASGNSLAAARAGASFSLAQSGNNIMVSYVPEPGSASLLLFGLASLALARASARRTNPV